MTYGFPRNSCLYHLRTFPDSALLCSKEQCLACTDGRWEETAEAFSPHWVAEIYALEDLSEL